MTTEPTYEPWTSHTITQSNPVPGKRVQVQLDGQRTEVAETSPAYPSEYYAWTLHIIRYRVLQEAVVEQRKYFIALSESGYAFTDLPSKACNNELAGHAVIGEVKFTMRNGVVDWGSVRIIEHE